ncbi:MAG TPA: flagellar hook-length control protein FliK [Solirubrobacteraceae bacterium]|nr:flagellar hook-length control protein FliK [Solirubrobacteraceae bacterium]
MTTDRTQPARPAAPTDRPAAAPGHRDTGNAFAALLDAHSAPARSDAPRRDDVRREDRADDRGHPRRDDAPRADRPARPDDAPRHETTAPRADAPAQPQEAATPATTAAPAQPTPTVPGFVVAPAADAAPAQAPAPPATPAPALSLPFETAPEAHFAPAAAPVAAAPTAPAAAPATTAPAPAAGQPLPAAQTAPATAPALPTEAEAVAPAPLPNQAAPQPATATAPQATPAEPAAAEPTASPVVAEPVEAQAPTHAAPARPAASEPAAPAPAAAAPAAESADAAPGWVGTNSSPLSGTVAPERAAPLHRTPAAVATLLQVAVDRGITRAKMALKPAELGGVEIRLQASAAGIAAQVVADSPEAAKLLAQAADDLRRALEARDVTLISLEISTTADDQQRQSARGEWSDGEGSFFGSDRTAAGDAEADAEPTPTSHSVIELPGGLLVDVLA